MSTLREKIGRHWSSTIQQQKGSSLKIRWWQSRYVVRHVNHLVCGEYLDGLSQGLVKRVSEAAGDRLPFKKAVSVGCGTGQKEMALIEQGIAESFDLYEFSDERIALGRELASKRGLTDRVNFVSGDALEAVTGIELYEMVHWNNSLHHMLDVPKALNWSWNVLKLGGLFFMDDYVGASRFQWPDYQLDIATRVRRAFRDTKYLEDPRAQGRVLPTEIRRPSEEALIAQDPSEAADSERILEAVKEYFPNARVTLTGGVVYHLVLNDMLHNFDEERDRAYMELLMLIDDLAVRAGETHYGVAWAFKGD